jgi:hypothetical protein
VPNPNSFQAGWIYTQGLLRAITFFRHKLGGILLDQCSHTLASGILFYKPVLPLGLHHFALDAVHHSHGYQEIMALRSQVLSTLP